MTRTFWWSSTPGTTCPGVAFLLTDLPVEVLGRMRPDRVLRHPTPPRVYDPYGGRPPKHGAEVAFGDPATWGDPDVTTTIQTGRYGTATAMS